jgi:hypothetical protein
MEGESAYYAVDVAEAAARLQETPDRVREMLFTGELEGIPPGATTQGAWKVLLPATSDLKQSADVDETPETASDEEDTSGLTPDVQTPVEPTDGASETLDEAATLAPPDAGPAPGSVSGEPLDETLRASDEEVRRDAGESGWTTTKQAAKVLGVSRRSVQGYVRRGLLAAREQGEGVNKTFLVSIDSLNALRDRRRREADKAAQYAETSAVKNQSANLYADTSEALRHAIDRVEARTAEATELRVRLEITERAESTLRAELEEERWRREEAERQRQEAQMELDAARRELEALERTREEALQQLPSPGPATTHPAAREATQTGVEPRSEKRVDTAAAAAGPLKPPEPVQAPEIPERPVPGRRGLLRRIFRG